MGIKASRFSLIVILFVGMFFGKHVAAQNYQLVNKDRKMTYARINEAGFDSIFYFMEINNFETVGDDSIFYLSPIIKDSVAGDCPYVYNDTVILGSKILVQSDTDKTYVFFNRNNDSIFIKSLIDVGDTWKVYKWSNGSYVKATVVNHLLRTVLPGIEDSLYRIQLNVYTLGGTMLTDTFPNATKIDITENYGIIEFFNFNIFPSPDDSIGRVLRGLENPDEGIVNIDAQNAFDFNTGYEFHYREESVPDNNSAADKRVTAWKYFVLAKTLSPGAATYTMERIQFDTLYFGGSPTSTVVWDTVDITYTYSDYTFLDALEFQVFENTHFGYSDWVKAPELFSGIPHKYVYGWYNYDEATKCLSNPDNIDMPEQLYGDGLGVMQYVDSTDMANYYSLNMTYFKQGLNEWGTPYDFSSLDNTAITTISENKLNLYPNPCANEIHFNGPYLNGDVTIFNINGELILETTSSNQTVDVSRLQAGVYYLRIQNLQNTAITSFVKL